MSVKRIFIKTPNEFMKMVNLLKASDIISFDTEFCDMRYPNLELIGMSFCIKDKEDYLSFYVTMNHKTVIHKIQKYKDKIIKEIKPILEDRDKLIIMHNAKSEIKIMWLHKIYIQDSEYFNKIFSGEEVNYEVPKEEHHIFDTMIASWCEYFSRPCGHGLKELTEEIYKKKSPHFKEIAFRDKKTKMWRIDLGDFKKVAYYACEDAINTYKLYEYFKPLIDNNKKTKKIFYELEMQQVKVLSEMEISGMPTSKKTLKKIGKNIDRELKILKKEIYKICGTKEINLNSMQQLNEVFFKKLKLKPKTKKGKNGFYSLGKTILILYAKEKIKIAEVLLKYRGLAKLKNTYIDKLIDKIVDNKLYSNFYQTSVVTGRLSSANPSFQTMPNNNLYPIRSAFKSQKGCKWICLDYNQLELRVASHYGDDKVMIEAFKNNVDIHGQISKLSFNLDCDANEVKKLYPEVRKKGKSLSFGLLYGMSYMTMAFRVNLEMDYDHEMSDDGAKKAMSNFFKSFPGIAKYIKTQKKLVNKYGKVKNLIGKIYDLPDGMLEVTDRRNYDIFKRKARAERQATNYPIQGGASSIITVAMRDIRNYFIERGNWMKNLFLVSQIHDKKMLLLSCINLLICWKVLKARYESGKSNLIRNQF